MFNYAQFDHLPTAADLPDSDDQPVDNELQNLIPNLLRILLISAWTDRQDWFFGVDMGIYYHPQKPAVVPDGFLSLGVNRRVDQEQGRLSYVLWEEQGIPPILSLEVISRTYGQEFERKKDLYAQLGILYYAIYTPNAYLRRGRKPLEVFRLEGGDYLPMIGDPVWLPEVGLGLGRERRSYESWEREWLYWYTQTGERLLTPQEQATQEQDRADRAERKAAQLAARLQALGLDPDEDTPEGEPS